MKGSRGEEQNKRKKEKDIEEKNRERRRIEEVKLINGSREISRESSIRGKTNERPLLVKFYSR